MRFEDWLTSTGLSKSSVLKYFGAVEGALSDWASEAGLIEGSLLEIGSKSKFDALALKIRELPIFLERNNTGHNMYGSALNKYSEFLRENAVSSLEEDLEGILADSTIGETAKAQLVNARIGQGQFRKALLAQWGRCAVTGVDNPALLLASHIKPWSKSNDAERLDPFNGLLLTPNLDRAFDQGLITFAESGDIRIAPTFVNAEALGINSEMHVDLKLQHQSYMEFHRAHVFKST